MFGPLGTANYDEYAPDIHHSGTHCSRVINDILDMSRIEAGRVRLELEDARSRAAVDELSARQRAGAPRRSIAVSVASRRLAATARRRRALKQIMLNLCPTR